ncbi:MAG: hypothetical protein LBG22_04840 [Treponema sp.]|jgi:hypothetical protein|nr:hypothetical protein [Treponema sp.]
MTLFQDFTMEEQQSIPLPPEYSGLTFEKVWAMFQESDRKFKEQMSESDRQFKEQMSESDRQFKEQIRESDRQFKETREEMNERDRKLREEANESERKLREQMRETDRRIGELGNRFGELAEHLVAPSIREKFNALHYTFDKISQNVDINDIQDRCSGAEIDLLLENGDVAIAVEVKAKPQYRDVDRHCERMEVLRRWADRHDDKRKFFGAVAGAILPKEVRDYTLKKGFYVIEQTGDTVRIDVPDEFKPREW